MGKIETATQWMIDLANDDSHGYDQDSRWGPDYDCSSSVISAWQYAGVPVKTKGASSTYDMKNVFLSCGFTNVISSVNVSTGAGLKRGDVLHRSGHTAMYIGNNKQVAAHLNEKGTTKGGKTGDQTGKEISVSAYSNSSSNPSILYFLPPSSCTSYFFPFLTLKSKGGVSYEFQFIIHYPKETVSKILPFNTLPDSNIGKRNIQFSIVIF